MILPEIISPLHFYAFYNLPHHLKKALKAGSPLMYSTEGENPLTIATNKKLQACVHIIIKYYIKSVKDNAYILNTINKNTIISLNAIGDKSLVTLYDSFIRHSNDPKLPRSVSGHSGKSIYYLSDHITPVLSHFNCKADTNGLEITFWESLVKLNYHVGSNDSIQFLTSLLNTRSPEIFKSTFIKIFLNYK